MNHDINMFLDDISSLRLDNVFNPYCEICPLYDDENSAYDRKKLLKELLINAKESDIEAIWIGRDLGYRGGRRTGLAFTDDLTLKYHLCRWNLDYQMLIRNNPIKEQTATIVWEMLNQINKNIFLWNLFPFHPYYAGNILSNRCHNAIERDIGIKILKSLINIIKPKYLVSVGNDAYDAIKNTGFDIECFKVRHPSYGGKKDFIYTISRLYDIPYEENKQLFLL